MAKLIVLHRPPVAAAVPEPVRRSPRARADIGNIAGGWLIEF